MKSVLSCSTNSYHGFSLEQALAGISAAGLKAVEIAAVPGYTEHVVPEQLNEKGLAALKEQLARLGLTVSSLSGHVDLTTETGLEQLKRRIKFARELGVGIVNTFAGHTVSKEKEEAFFANIAAAADVASRQGVILAVETHGGIMGRSSDCRRTMERINHPNVGINYDPANVIFYTGDRPEQTIDPLLPFIRHVHLKDKIGGKDEWNFPALGTGTVDFECLLGKLLGFGYTGPLSIEIEFTSEGAANPETVDRAVADSYRYITELIARCGW